MYKTRPSFTHSSLLAVVRAGFDKVRLGPSPSDPKPNEISLSDCLMSGLAIFSLKYPSLLKFDQEKDDPDNPLQGNLKSVYSIAKIPCDTYLRERLDHESILPQLRRVFASLLHIMQRGKALEEWKFLDKKFLISLDATGFFSSHDIKCNYCLEKVHNKGKEDEQTLYHHQMLVGAVVSPLMKSVLPIGFEPILKQDGNSKNDCERNCAKRWLKYFKEDHPHLPVIIVADGLYSNAP